MVERSFGILKGRWRCLKHLRVHDIDFAGAVIEACVILHNICLEDETEDEINDFFTPDILLASKMCAESTEALKAGTDKEDKLLFI